MKNKSKMPFILIGLIIIGIIVIFISIAVNNGSHADNVSTSKNYSSSKVNSSSSKSSSSKTRNLSGYKTNLSYDDLSNNADNLAEYVAFSAKVLEVHDDLSVLVGMNNDENQKIMIDIPADNIYENKIKKDEIITAYGMNTSKQSFNSKKYGKINVPVLIGDTIHVGIDSNVSVSESSSTTSSSSSSSSETSSFSQSELSSNLKTHLEKVDGAKLESVSGQFDIEPYTANVIIYDKNVSAPVLATDDLIQTIKALKETDGNENFETLMITVKGTIDDSKTMICKLTFNKNDFNNLSVTDDTAFDQIKSQATDSFTRKQE